MISRYLARLSRARTLAAESRAYDHACRVPGLWGRAVVASRTYRAPHGVRAYALGAVGYARSERGADCLARDAGLRAARPEDCYALAVVEAQRVLTPAVLVGGLAVVAFVVACL